MKVAKKKPVVELEKDGITIDFSLNASLIDEFKHVLKIKGLIKDMETDDNVGVLTLDQINLDLAVNDGEDWRDLIDSVDDDFLRVCEPVIDPKRSSTFSKEFTEMLDDHFEDLPSTILVISKVGIYKKYRGNNLLGSILEMIRLLNPKAPIIADPFPLQYNGSEENLKIMGIKSEKKTTRECRMRDQQNLVKHYEKHGFKKLGNSGTWVLI